MQQARPIIDEAERLVLLRDYRDLTDSALRSISEPAEGLYIAESLKVLDRALRAGHRPRSVLTEAKWLPDLEEVLARHPGINDVPLLVADAAELESITGYRVHRGTLASMHRPALPEPAAILRGARRVVVLDSIVDHTNVGAIFRSAAAFGADAVVLTPEAADPLYRRSVRVSMGTVFQVPWTRLPSWPAAADILHEAGLTILALALTADAISLDAVDTSMPYAVVFGTEGDGLSRRALHAADQVVIIPMSGGVDSLNVAAASAVTMWHLREQRG